MKNDGPRIYSPGTVTSAAARVSVVARLVPMVPTPEIEISVERVPDIAVLAALMHEHRVVKFVACGIEVGVIVFDAKRLARFAILSTT